MGWFVAVLAAAGLAALSGGSCAKDDDTSTDIQETGQQVGDAMASVDESGGSSGSLALVESAGRTFARVAPADFRPAFSLVPEAQATTCALASTFGSCSSNVITRTFGGCTVGAATFDGTVTLTFSDATSDNTCQLTANGHSITRNPSFTVTGRRGATLSVLKTGTNGQVVTRTGAGVFSFTNDGIRRYFTANGATLFDYTTQTTSAVTVTGANRASRTLSGGNLRVTNNLTGTTCDFVPSSVTWGSSTCNCPNSGTWSASCSDGKSASLAITGCGTATLTVGAEQESFSFDRCYGS